MKNEQRRASVIGALALTAAAFSQSAFAQPAADTPRPYEWSAELVSFDEASATVTMKARMDTRVDKEVVG